MREERGWEHAHHAVRSEERITRITSSRIPRCSLDEQIWLGFVHTDIIVRDARERRPASQHGRLQV